ncbi:Belongs to the peptidase S8 [Savitreella phatthalungensis]
MLLALFQLPLLAVGEIRTQLESPWHLERISRPYSLVPDDGRNIWERDISRNEYEYRYDNGARGTGVLAFVLDLGVQNSQFTLQGHTETPPEADFSRFYDRWFHKYMILEEPLEHGTAVAGVLGGRGIGVAPEAQMISVRVGRLYGMISIVSAIQYISHRIIRDRKPAVVNFSLGTRLNHPFVRAILRLQALTNAHIVSAASNSNGNTCRFTSINWLHEVITVSGTDSDDNYIDPGPSGSCIDILAPAVDIPTARASPRSDVSMLLVTGNSVAAPLVSGVLACWLSNQRLAPSLNPPRAKALLRSNAWHDEIHDLPRDVPNLLLRSVLQGNLPNSSP